MGWKQTRVHYRLDHYRPWITTDWYKGMEADIGSLQTGSSQAMGNYILV